MSTTGQAGSVAADESFTEADLRAAVRRSGETESYVQALLADMREHREPEYERGRFYQDAAGSVFFRVLGDGDGWSLMPEGKPYPGAYPRRPLRRLVPEPGAGSEPEQPAAAELEVVVPGEMYQDRIGQRFYRLSSGDGWLMLPEGVRFEDGGRFLAYPLRKLVPEGRKAGHGQILAELTQRTNLPRAEAVDLAWRICKLTGGECDGGV